MLTDSDSEALLGSRGREWFCSVDLASSFPVLVFFLGTMLSDSKVCCVCLDTDMRSRNVTRECFTPPEVEVCAEAGGDVRESDCAPFDETAGEISRSVEASVAFDLADIAQ